MSKALLILGSLAAAGAAVGFILNLKGKEKAAQDLKLDFGSLKVTKASVKEGVIMDVILKVTNNSPHELKFTQPFVEVLILNSEKKLTPIASSTDAEGMTVISPRKVSELKFNLQITPLNALKIPALLMHFVKKFAGLNPEPKKVQIRYGIQASGIDITDKSDVNL